MSDESQEAPETRDASEAVKALSLATLQRFSREIEELSAMALRDAKLDPADGWRYDPQRGVYVKQ